MSGRFVQFGVLRVDRFGNAAFQHGGKEAVAAVVARIQPQAGAGIEFDPLFGQQHIGRQFDEIGVGGQEGVDDGVVLGRQDRTGCIDQAAAVLQQAGGVGKDAGL